MTDTPLSVDKLIRKELKWVNENFDAEIKPHLEHCSAGSLQDICNARDSYYYRYLAAMMKALKPKLVVELGSAGGASALMMLSTLPKTSKLYACSIKEPEGEFRFIKPKKYPNLTLVRGNDLTMGTWRSAGIDFRGLRNADIWFIDTIHSASQLTKELTIYNRFFKQGAVILLDDIRLNDMPTVWNKIKFSKLSLPDLHWSGFGMVLVDRTNCL